MPDKKHSHPHHVAVIGCGHWGKNLVRNFNSLEVLAGVNDADEKRAALISQEFGVPLLSLADILEDEKISGVVIATPAETHYQVARQALNAGKHVFVEKPMSLNPSEAEELCALSKEKGRILMVGHLLQYHPAFRKLKELCDEGRLGALRYIYSNRLNFGIFRATENTLWSFAPHDISMILSLFDDVPINVSAIGHSFLQPGCADVTTTHLVFEGNRAAHIFVSWLHPFKEQRLIVVGDKGMGVFDDTMGDGEKLLLYPHQVDWKEGLPIPSKAKSIAIEVASDEPLLVECRHFLECLEKDAIPLTDGEEGLRVLRVLDAAETSILNGGK